MSGKRKAAQVEGQDGAVSSDHCVQLEKQAKKHITTTSPPFPSTPPQPSSPPSSVDRLPPSSLPQPSTPPLPSSPRTAPLPSEVPTPPALDDALLASLTLSPQPCLGRRRLGDAGGRCPSTAGSQPSSPARSVGGGWRLGKRSRQRGELPEVPLLPVRATTGSAEVGAEPHAPRSAEGASPSDVSDASAPLGSAAPAVSAMRSPSDAKAAPVGPQQQPGGAAQSPAGPARSSNSSLHALNVDSAIRGMQGISLSSLSSTSPASLTPLIASTVLSASFPSALSSDPSAASPTLLTPRPLPLIRLTLNYSGVRRTASNESAQGNLKKHKRSVLSPSPIHTTSADKDPITARNTSHAEAVDEDNRSAHQQWLLRSHPPREQLQPGKGEAESEDEGELQSVASESSEPAVRSSVGRVRDEEEEESASVSSIDTALSVSSLQVRSPSSSTVASSTSSSAVIRCDVCNKELSSAAQLEDHQQGRRHQHVLLMRERGGAFACEPCSKSFTSAADQEKHAQGDRHREVVQAMQARGGEGKATVLVLTCELCGVTFTGLTQQRQHLEGKKHQAMAREQQRHSEGKEEGGKERRKREDSKGQDNVDSDGLNASKKRKYGRPSSPAIPQPAASHPHLQAQQQPSPTPRRIQPRPLLPSSASQSSPVKATQTIRYITPPPSQVPQTRRWSSRSVGSGSSEGSAGPDGGQWTDGASAERRPGGFHHPHPQRASLAAEDSSDAQSYASSPSTFYDSSPGPWEAGGHYGYSYPPYLEPPALFASPYPVLPPADFHYGPATYSAHTHPLPNFFSSPPPPPPSFLQAPLAAPMFAYLSPSAAAALSGPIVPSLTPVTVLYPSELVRQQLLLSQHYVAPHPFALPPLYVLPAHEGPAHAEVAAADGEQEAAAAEGIPAREADAPPAVAAVQDNSAPSPPSPREEVDSEALTT